MENLNESLSEASMHPIVISSIQQPQKEVVSLQQTLFDCGPKRDQSEMWWGMPEFTHGDATPQKTLLINFLTYKDFEQFCKHIGFQSVTKIWDHAISSGAKKHWVVDDNIDGLVRCNYNRRLSIKGTASPIAAIEDWCDRYENIAFAGPHHQGFVDSRRPTVTPIWMNRRVYSFILVNTSLPYRWRGKYNEDTDICLRALKDGWCTVLFRSLLMNKGATLKMKGGNTETVYAEDEHRRKFAESLAEQHPDVVKITYKFGRWHHQVDYSSFERNPLLMRPDVVPVPVNDEYGLELVRLK
jgi:hypothetical protein